ncbi:MAG: hypothetical protein M0R48_07415 [Candidatus Omnitrophica bacterium]|jgi:hypothetical protein|nr:hypothetical protein [Candidatus Omnitrophota bacterium]
MRKILILLLAGIILSTGGCYSLRKKFIRKKKYQKEEPVYINFKNYPAKPSRDAYVDYFLFVKGWIDDLTESLRIERFNTGYNTKREKRAINGAVMNLEQIISFFNQEGKEKIYPLYIDLVKIRDSMEKSPNMSSPRRALILQKIEHFRREFEAEFKYSEAQKWMD